MVNTESRSEPGFVEKAAGRLFWASAAVALILFLAGGEVDVLQDIPGVGAMLLFGKIWLNEHSERKGYDKTKHIAHHGLRIGSELARQRITRRS